MHIKNIEMNYYATIALLFFKLSLIYGQTDTIYINQKEDPISLEYHDSIFSNNILLKEIYINTAIIGVSCKKKYKHLKLPNSFDSLNILKRVLFEAHTITLPHSIVKKQQLSSLHIGGCIINNNKNVFDDMSGLKNLRVFYFQVGEYLDAAILEELSKLKKLEYINIKIAELNDVSSSISKLKNLIFLRIRSKTSVVLPLSFNALDKLKYLELNIDLNTKQNIISLMKLGSLEELVIDEIRYHSQIPEELKRLTQLKQISLNANFSNAILINTLSQLPQLEVLTLNINKDTNVNLAENIAKLNSLKAIILTSTDNRFRRKAVHLKKKLKKKLTVNVKIL